MFSKNDPIYLQTELAVIVKKEAISFLTLIIWQSPEEILVFIISLLGLNLYHYFYCLLSSYVVSRCFIGAYYFSRASMSVQRHIAVSTTACLI